MTKSPRVYKSAKVDILNVARKILVEEGLGHLTTDNLIAKTGLSKGGFFYHFKSIDDLISALSENLISEMEKDLYERAARDEDKKGAILRAAIQQSIADDSLEHIALCRSLIEILFNKSLFKNYSDFFEKFKKHAFNEGIDKMTVMNILYALDGYWFGEVFGLELYPKKDKKKFLQHLLTFTH